MTSDIRHLAFLECTLGLKKKKKSYHVDYELLSNWFRKIVILVTCHISFTTENNCQNPEQSNELQSMSHDHTWSASLFKVHQIASTCSQAAHLLLPLVLMWFWKRWNLLVWALLSQFQFCFIWWMSFPLHRTACLKLAGPLPEAHFWFALLVWLKQLCRLCWVCPRKNSAGRDGR